MAHGDDLFGLDQTDTAESTFDTVYLGGYSKSQVDRAMARLVARRSAQPRAAVAA